MKNEKRPKPNMLEIRNSQRRSITGDMSTTTIEFFWPTKEDNNESCEIKFEIDTDDVKEAMDFVRWATIREYIFDYKIKVTLEFIKDDE